MRGVSDHPPALYHLPLRECFPDVWLAASTTSMSIPLRLKITFSRNMVAVRGPDGWVLLNPVRLSESTEAELLAQAPFKHAVRLGTYHGRDDRYYVDKFGVEFWGVPGQQTYPEPKFSREITEEEWFPIPGARAVIFKNATRAECVAACRSTVCSSPATASSTTTTTRCFRRSGSSSCIPWGSSRLASSGRSG